MTDYTPSAANALFPAYVGRVRTDPGAYAAYDTAAQKLALAKYGAYEWDNELLKHQALLLSGPVGLPVRNESGGDYVAGALVYVSGYSTAESKYLILKADADDAAKAAMFVLTAAIANNANGYAYAYGDVAGLDTSAAAAVGDPVYLSGTAGAWTLTAPASPANKQRVGVVTVDDAVTGAIHFFPGAALQERLFANPFADDTALVKGAASPTKLMRIDVETNVAAGATRVLTMPNADINLTPGSGDFVDADLSAQGKFVGRKTAGAGKAEECAFDGSTLELPAGGDARVKDGGITTAQVAAAAVTPEKTDFALANFALNPSFEKVLPGTHTTAIKRLAGAVTLNCQFPCWKLVGDNAGADLTVDEETVEITGQSLRSMKVTVVNSIGEPQIAQHWTAAEKLTGTGAAAEMVASFRGKRFNFSADVKQSAATASALRLFVTTDGTGGTTTFGSYHGATIAWERLFVSVLVPADATYIYFGFSIEHATPDFYLDNCAVLPSTATLTALAYQPRLPVDLGQSLDNGTNNLIETTPTAADTWYPSNGAEPSTPWDVNAARPAWADGCVVQLTLFDPTNIGSAEVAPYGAVNSDCIVSIEVVSRYVATNGQTKIGKDGQLQIRGSQTTGTIYVGNKGWFGKGL